MVERVFTHIPARASRLSAPSVGFQVFRLAWGFEPQAAHPYISAFPLTHIHPTPRSSPFRTKSETNVRTFVSHTAHIPCYTDLIRLSDEAARHAAPFIHHKNKFPPSHGRNVFTHPSSLVPHTFFVAAAYPPTAAATREPAAVTPRCPSPAPESPARPGTTARSRPSPALPCYSYGAPCCAPAR